VDDSTVPTNHLRGAFTGDPGALTDPATRQAFQAQIGNALGFPELDPNGPPPGLVHVQAARVYDFATAVTSFVPSLRASPSADGTDDLVWLHVVDHGAWTIGKPGDPESRTLSAGQFALRHYGTPVPQSTAPGTRGRTTVLPSSLLRALPRDRVVTGDASSAEIRMLLAHTSALHATVMDLGPAGVRAAHDAAIELVSAVARGVVDGGESQLEPTLVRAAKTLAASLLSEPELSSDLLARQLRVSQRTLQRAFANEGTSVASYIRDQRLEAVRRALDAGRNRPSVAELAAHWQFADGGHLTRLFRRRFGMTPTDYSRTAGAPEPPSPARHV
jgi:AraC-like DNA-binding protein